MTGCPHCGAAVFRKSADGGKLKARTRIVVLHKGGSLEINCHACGKGLLLPVVVPAGGGDLRKAEAPKLIARKT